VVISLRARDLRDLTDDELQHRLADTRQELFNLRFQAATGALENTTRLKLAKREIARILTVQHDRGTTPAGSSKNSGKTSATKQKVQS
jgi:large subunit ribosomal protein L29